MLSIICYLAIIALLIIWLESPFFLPNNSLITRKVQPDQLLEDWLKNFRWGMRGELTQKAELPRYKFYSEVVEVLLNLARKMGGNYQDSLLFLREGLQADRQFEKKNREVILGTWLQMGLMMLLTWAFILGALAMVEVNVPFWKLSLILIWQMMGLSLLPVLIRFFRRRFFADIGKLWRMLYILNSLIKVPLARSEIFNLAGVLELKNIQQKSLMPIVEKLKSVCQQTLQNGGSYEEEVKNLMNELRFQEKWHFELFEKRLTVIKLAIMSIFFLPSYLGFIFLLLGDLMQLM